jgi:hypothetical protein
MMNVHISAVENSAAFKEFVTLPWRIYAMGGPCGHEPCPWVPPLLAQERALISPQEKHPFWAAAQGRLFIAVRGMEVVGRIAAIVDEKYNDYAGQHCGAWGFFECIDDYEAAAALFEAAADWLRAQGMSYMRGPLNPSTNYTCGVLTQGFDRQPAVMMPWNPPYYPAYMERWGMRKEQDLLAYVIGREAFSRPEWLQKQLDILHERGEFTCRTSSRAQLEQDIHTMLGIYQASWAKNWAFVPMSEAEAEHHVRDLKSVLDPNFFVLFFHNNEPVGGMLALPDLNPLLKRLNGKLGLLAPWHYWQCRKEMRRGYRVVLFGLKEEFRMAGLPFLLVDFLLQQAEKNPEFQWIEGSWLLEDNTAVCDLMQDFGGKVDKRYRIYRKEL